MGKTFKILSIDGGGIKGLYSSTILEHLEKKYGNLSDYFDLLCGTSTGGLIVLGISLKIPASEISEIYINNGSKIFPTQSKVKGIIKQSIWKGKYNDKPLVESLKKVFGERTLSESNNLLCIPSYSLTDARPWVFKYDHPEGRLNRDNKAKYVDVALATSAAPTYLPLTEISDYDYKQFIDGGVWANNPSLVGLLEALTYFVGIDKEYDKIQLLSVSSLNSSSGKPTGLKRHRSFIHWRDDLFNTSLIGQSFFTDFFLQKLKQLNGIGIEYERIPSAIISSEQNHLVQLDIASENAIRFIKGLGNDRGNLVTKDENIGNFFLTQKSYKTN